MFRVFGSVSVFRRIVMNLQYKFTKKIPILFRVQRGVGGTLEFLPPQEISITITITIRVNTIIWSNSTRNNTYIVFYIASLPLPPLLIFSVETLLFH